jgi:FMN phosphatase YigB (HAD superfamily)
VPPDRPVRAVTFDVWHTLLYLEPDDEDAYMTRQQELGRRYLEERPRRESGAMEPGAAFRRAFEESIRAADEGRSISSAAQLLRAAEWCGRTVDPAPYIEALEGLVAGLPLRPAPGVRAALAGLGELGFRVGVISNTVGEPGRALRRVCEREGIAPHVSGWSFSDELPWAKPAREIFHHGLEQLGATPDRAVHVGDGASDIEGARRAGYRGSVFFTGLRRYGALYRRFFAASDPRDLRPTREVARLEELLRVVPELLGGPTIGSPSVLTTADPRGPTEPRTP